ncbi:protein of unknown function [Pseudonocardia thermophila]|jgi:hypothetical protein|uniref:Protein-glutamine gamma-glutamyltransferase-like C-terminal domain-containing protein n=1 Tax=Pseudonocardia thermophila TaxID=1848 RepID=A0A1M6PAW3_PSETH|nr:DUF4129 domain-containing protein [Pseudonocardia thermophila]SHK05083.1 protein of unknown function [Pseudonocardia thermophila]
MTLPPIDIGRDEAADAAARELARPIYHDDRGLIATIFDWIVERIADLIAVAADATPGGYLSLLVLLAVLVAAIVVIRLRIGSVGRSTYGAQELFSGGPVPAAEHRREADAFAARGEWAEAVRSRMRAIVRGLEERDLLDVRPGRTADEAAREAGAVLPQCATDLRAAAAVFDDVWYGERPATQEMDAQLRAVDAAVARARPAIRA